MKDEKVSVKSLVVFAVLAFLLVLVGIFVIIGPMANDDRYLIEIPVKAPLSNSGNSGTAFFGKPLSNAEALQPDAAVGRVLDAIPVGNSCHMTADYIRGNSASVVTVYYKDGIYKIVQTGASQDSHILIRPDAYYTWKSGDARAQRHKSEDPFADAGFGFLDLEKVKNREDLGKYSGTFEVSFASVALSFRESGAMKNYVISTESGCVYHYLEYRSGSQNQTYFSIRSRILGEVSDANFKLPEEL